MFETFIAFLFITRTNELYTIKILSSPSFSFLHYRHVHAYIFKAFFTILNIQDPPLC